MLDSSNCVAKLGQILQPLHSAFFGETFNNVIYTSQSLGLFAVHKEISKGTLETSLRTMSPRQQSCEALESTRFPRRKLFLFIRTTENFSFKNHLNLFVHHFVKL